MLQDAHESVAQCNIEMVSIEGQNPVANASRLREYGKNLMFEPLPLEMMFADAQKPQVLVKVNGLEGICPEFNCDYLYIATVSEITSQTLTNGVDLVI